MSSVFLTKKSDSEDYMCRFVSNDAKEYAIPVSNSLDNWLSQLAMVDNKNQKVYVEGVIQWVMPVSKDVYKTSLESEILYNQLLVLMGKVPAVK